jgi:hypothetical protein
LFCAFAALCIFHAKARVSVLLTGAKDHVLAGLDGIHDGRLDQASPGAARSNCRPLNKHDG